MKNILIIGIFILVFTLTAQDQPASFGFSAKIDDQGDANWQSESKQEEILIKLKTLEDKYLSQLQKRQYLEASMLIKEIREIITGKSTAATEVNTQVSATTETTQNVNINMNISGFDNPSTPNPQPNIVITEPVMKSFPAQEVISNSAFNQLINNIQDESFAEDQIRYVRTAAKSHFFTVAQTEQLIDLFAFSEDKLDCLRIAYPKVIDKDNSFMIISHFTYEEDKRSAESIINQ